MRRKLYLHHKTGGVYKILHQGLLEADAKTLMVIYTDHPNNTNVWVRPFDEFFDGRFQHIGEFPEPEFDPVQDIEDFHTHFGLDYSQSPRALPKDLEDFRLKFLQEEKDEYAAHQRAAYDETTRPPNDRDHVNYTYHLEEALDGLVDLVYVALGTSYLHGFNFREAWRRVHEANMKKVRAQLDTDSKRGSTLDVVKPAGWGPPNHADLVEVNDLGEPHWDRA